MADRTLYPNTFQHHNAYVDQVSFLLTGNEEKVLNHIIREIIGFQENAVMRQAHIAISILVNGKVSQKGERIAYGCGLKEGAVRAALNTLCDFNLIERIGLPTQDGQCYSLQLNFDKIDWQKMYARKEAQDEAFRQQMTNARRQNHKVFGMEAPLLLNSTPSVEQTPPPPVEQTPPPPVEQDTKNPLLNPLPNPPGPTSALDTFFGPQDPATTLPPSAPVNLQDEQARTEYLASLLQQRAARAEGEPWRRAYEWISHPRQGIERDTLRRVAWTFTQAGVPEPQSDKARGEWRTALPAVYQESGGDFGIIKVAAQEIVKSGLSYWPPHRWHQQISTLKAQNITQTSSTGGWQFHG